MTKAGVSSDSPIGVCSRCGTAQRAPITSVVDSVATPDQFRQAVGGALNFVRCTHCGNTVFANAPFILRDTDRNLLAVYTGYLAQASTEERNATIETLTGWLRDTIGEPVKLGEPEIHDDYQALHQRLRALYEPAWISLLRRVADLPPDRQAPELAAASVPVVREMVEAVQNKRVKFPNADQVVESLQTAVLAARHLSDSPMLAACLFQLGVTTLDARRFAEAESALLEAESLCTSLENLSRAALCRSRLGFVYKDQDDLPRAAEAFRNAAERYEKLNEHYMQLLQLASLGEVLGDVGDTKSAVESLTRATELARKEKREFEMGYCERRIATVYRRSGNLEAAAQFLRSASEHYRSAEKASDYSDVMHALFEVQFELGQREAALSTLESAISWHRERRNLGEMAELELEVARVRAETGSWGEAVAAIERAAAAHSEGNERGKQGLDYFTGGRLAQSRGEWAAALELLQKASDAYTKAEDADGFAASQYNMAVCHLAQSSNAEQALALARKAAESFPDPMKALRALVLIATCLISLSRFEDARDTMELIEKITSRFPDPPLAPAILELRARIALAGNDVDGARKLMEQSLDASSDPLVRATLWLSIAGLHRDSGATTDRTNALENSLRELGSAPQTLLTLPVSIELADALVKQREYRSARALLDSITPLLTTLAVDKSVRPQAAFNMDFAIVLEQAGAGALGLRAMAQLVLVCLHLCDYNAARASARLAISAAQGTQDADEAGAYKGILAWLDFRLGENVRSVLMRLLDATAKARAGGRTGLLRLLLNNLASVAAVAGETELALKSITEGIELAADVDPDVLAESESTRVFILRKQGRYDLAIQQVDAALASLPSGGSSPGMASLKLAKAELLGDMARYREGIDLYESVAQATREMDAPELMAMALGGQARLWFFLADYPKAHAAHSQALALWRKLGDAGNVAAELADLALVHRSLGDPEKAIEALREAAAIETETGRDVSRAITLGNLADLLADRRAALDGYAEALKIFRRAGEVERVGHVLMSLARAHYELNETDRASECIDEAITHLTAPGSSRFLINAYTVRSFVREAQGKLDEAYADALEALKRKQSVRGGLAYAADRLTYARIDAAQAEDRAVALAVATGREREAWVLVENVRSRLLAEELTRHAWPAPAGVPDSLIERERGLLGQLQSSELRTPYSAGAQGKASLLVDVDGVTEELHRVWGEIEKHAPDYVAMRRGDSLSFQELTNVLRADVDETLAALELVLLRDTLLTVAYRSDWEAPVISTVGLDAAAAQEILASFENEVIEYPRHVRAKLAFQHSWRSKLEALLAPALQPLLRASCLYLVPHGWLHNLPLHALRVGDEAVAAQTRVAYVPSITVLARLLRARPRAALSGESLVVGYSEEAATRPDIEGEAQDVARIVSATPLIGAAATRDNVCSAFGRATLIHLSCHCGFDRQSPLDSSIELADGALTAARLMTHDLGGAFVNLSGCQTALVMRDAADEPMGIPRAALLAGAGALLATLWRVDAAATRRFMNAFYIHLAQTGEGRNAYATAAREAAASLRQNAGFEPAYFWAAFKLIGPIHRRDAAPATAAAAVNRP
jgi:CHAT domain-containing protein/tetratricopeptide (TPR) repeat protein